MFENGFTTGSIMASTPFTSRTSTSRRESRSALRLAHANRQLTASRQHTVRIADTMAHRTWNSGFNEAAQLHTYVLTYVTEVRELQAEMGSATAELLDEEAHFKDELVRTYIRRC